MEHGLPVPAVGKRRPFLSVLLARFSLQATDADSGMRGNITFSIVSVVLVEDNGVSRPFENLFQVVTTPEQDIYVGSIQ